MWWLKKRRWQSRTPCRCWKRLELAYSLFSDVGLPPSHRHPGRAVTDAGVLAVASLSQPPLQQHERPASTRHATSASATSTAAATGATTARRGSRCGAGAAAATGSLWMPSLDPCSRGRIWEMGRDLARGAGNQRAGAGNQSNLEAAIPCAIRKKRRCHLLPCRARARIEAAVREQ